ncbi:MAG: transcriptional regulator PpsR [Gammaproteobacteria bacterium]|nr:transcriptional regulator PpsR [Gammaproteobacteria bacterium]
MEAAISQRFRAPQKSFGQINAEGAAALLSIATDVALVIDANGVIEDLSLSTQDAALDSLHRWVGRRWLDTVTVESRPKVEELLRDAGDGRAPRWRHLNHPMADGVDVPIMYSVVELGQDGHKVALGRDIRPLAVLQRRLVDAQQAMERDYLRLRQAESRYRMLFNIASEAVLIVDAGTRIVLEANPAAGELLGDTPERIVGRAFPQGFDIRGSEAVVGLLAAVRNAGKTRDVSARLARGDSEIIVSASLFKQDDVAHYVIRLNRALVSSAATSSADDARKRFNGVLDRLPDGIVITDEDGHVLSVNRAFLQLVQLEDEQQALGASLEQWLGLPGVDLTVLLAHLREHGSVRLFKTVLRDQYNGQLAVEICAVSVADGERHCYALSIRNVDQRLSNDDHSPSVMPRSMDQLTELVGRVPLKDLVREAADVVERLCIEAALNLTGDNRASAAEILGLSRQSLYVKLRRHGLGDLRGDGDE